MILFNDRTAQPLLDDSNDDLQKLQIIDEVSNQEFTVQFVDGELQVRSAAGFALIVKPEAANSIRLNY